MKVDSWSSLTINEFGPGATRSETAQSTMSYTIDALGSGIPSLTDKPSGYDLWWMQQFLDERLRDTAPMGEQRKFGNGGDAKGLMVQPFSTCATMSADRAEIVEGDSYTDLRLTQSWFRAALSPWNPKFAP